MAALLTRLVHLLHGYCLQTDTLHSRAIVPGTNWQHRAIIVHLIALPSAVCQVGPRGTDAAILFRAESTCARAALGA